MCEGEWDQGAFVCGCIGRLNSRLVCRGGRCHLGYREKLPLVERTAEGCLCHGAVESTEWFVFLLLMSEVQR